MTDIKENNIVSYLLPGSPDMMVSSLNEDKTEALCVWFSDDKKIQYAWFKLGNLKKKHD